MSPFHKSLIHRSIHYRAYFYARISRDATIAHRVTPIAANEAERLIYRENDEVRLVDRMLSLTCEL